MNKKELEEIEQEKLYKFLDSKEHYKDTLTDILYFGRKFELLEPNYLEVYNTAFYIPDKLGYQNYGIKTIIGGEIGSQGRYRIDYLTYNSRNESFKSSVKVEDFIRMIKYGKIKLIY